MPVSLPKDLVLSRFRSAVDEAYGPRVERVILYGSRAGGEARSGSDYDSAVFLCELSDRAREMDRLADIGTDILYDIGGLVHALPHVAGSYSDRTPLMHEIREDGIDL
jgi:uncharacterized protein